MSSRYPPTPPASCCPPASRSASVPAPREEVTLSRVRLTESLADALASPFKALGDPVRLRLLSMIASAPNGEVCVCEMTPAFRLTGPTISHHLRILREAGLVDAERRGTFVYYRAEMTLLRHLAAVLIPRPPPAGPEPPSGTAGQLRAVNLTRRP